MSGTTEDLPHLTDQTLGDGEITYIRWAPDGEHLVCTTRQQIKICSRRAPQEYLVIPLSPLIVPIWSLDNKTVACISSDRTIRLYNTETGKEIRVLGSYNTQWICSLAWSPDGGMIAAGCNDGTVRIWNAETGDHKETCYIDGARIVCSVAWSMDGQKIACGTVNNSISIYDRSSKIVQKETLNGHFEAISALVWLDAVTLASGSSDRTIRIWNVPSGQLLRTLEGHTASIEELFYVPESKQLISKADTLLCWPIGAWEERTDLLQRIPSDSYPTQFDFHPASQRLALIYREEESPVIYTLREEQNIVDASISSVVEQTVSYTVAKVILVGETGVGKTGLGIVMTGEPFKATCSSHNRNVWTLESKDVSLPDGSTEMREITLLDLAGQPGYRLIHQLYLDEVALALVLFNPQSETDPFAGIESWHHALNRTEKEGSQQSQPKKFLVAARIDSGGLNVSQARIDEIKRELNFDLYHPTSAKEGKGIAELTASVKQAIDWNTLPRVTSTQIFQKIKSFLLEEKSKEIILATRKELQARFQCQQADELRDERQLTESFETCLRLLVASDFIYRFSFNDMVLLKPELLDHYASALINYARSQTEPDDIGMVSEELVYQGKFFIPEYQRLEDKEQERQLLLALVKYIVEREIVLREETENGVFLVFPSQSIRELPELSLSRKESVVFTFEGRIEHIYTTLVVRLSRSFFFRKVSFWKNAVCYTTELGGEYTILLKNEHNGRARIKIFFDKGTSKDMQFYFSRYIERHLKERAVKESVQRETIFTCPACNTRVTEEQRSKRLERGYDTVRCNVCETAFSILLEEEEASQQVNNALEFMNIEADRRREREEAKAVINSKQATADYDVFFCCHPSDEVRVEEIGRQLLEKGLLPWFGKWENRPGFSFLNMSQKQIPAAKAVAFFIGKHGLDNQQLDMLEAFLNAFNKNDQRDTKPIIPVLLSEVAVKPEMHPFLGNRTWVDFREGREVNPLQSMIWGITGERPLF